MVQLLALCLSTFFHKRLNWLIVILPHTLPQSVEGLEKLFRNLFIPIDMIRRIPNSLQTSLLALAKATKSSQNGLQGFFNFQDLLLSIMKKVWSVSLLFCFVCSARGGKKNEISNFVLQVEAKSVRVWYLSTLVSIYSRKYLLT